MFQRKFLHIVFLFSLCFHVNAQNPVSWTLEIGSRNLKANEKFKAKLSAKIEEGWYLYAMDQPEGGPMPLKISIAENSPFEVEGKIIQTENPLSKYDKNFGLETRYFIKQAEFLLSLKALKEIATDELITTIRYQACNDTFCLPPRTIKLSRSGIKTESATSEFNNPIGATDNQKNNARQQQSANESKKNSSTSTSVFSTSVPIHERNLSFWAFIWLAVTLGALSLLTPCVFPMIPITVSYFTNQASKEKSKALKLALIYSLGIVATFSVLGMLLAVFVGAAGINLFAANPWVNLLIAGIFLFFAFNLFGAYEIAIPISILSKLDKITRAKEGEGSQIIGTLLMGLTFTLTSFTCTSPFVGTILVSAAQGDWQMPLLGMLAFSIPFATPFFVLALIPQYLASLPKAGSWMNSIKVTMGFLEVAAAMKFISNVDLVWKWGVFTRPVVLSFWIAIGFLLTLYLLGKFQLFYDSKPEKIGTVRLTAAIVTLAISFYLLTGLFGAKLGELESFLPPDLNQNSFLGNASKEKLAWIENNLEEAKRQAKAENKRIFVDFTGYTCTNCRWMEANIFTRPEVQKELERFVLLRLYTDGKGELYERQQKFQEEKFKTVALPFYAIIEADEKIIAVFPGLTRDVSEFLDFLKSG
jgi:thiol:disulfide interchange protein